jgi:hypothetical protein
MVCYFILGPWSRSTQFVEVLDPCVFTSGVEGHDFVEPAFGAKGIMVVRAGFWYMQCLLS